MNFIHDEIIIKSTKNTELINITSQINEIIETNKVHEGLINIATQHTTSAIIINEDEEGLKQDIINLYEEIVSYNNYFHDKIDNNARSHLKSLLSNPNQTLPIVDGKLKLGIWQSVFFMELDGPRKSRKISITLIY